MRPHTKNSSRRRGTAATTFPRAVLSRLLLPVLLLLTATALRPSVRSVAGGVPPMLPAAAAAAGAPGVPNLCHCPALAEPPPAGTQRLFLTIATANDGSRTQRLAFNGSRVGPTLWLALGQRYQVDVTNADVAEGTTVHWHGLVLGPEDAWADGAQGLTQAPIPPATASLWYHSHLPGQLADGLRGALVVVEDPGDDPLAHLYDSDGGGDSGAGDGRGDSGAGDGRGDSGVGDSGVGDSGRGRGEHVVLVGDVFRVSGAEQLRRLQRNGMGMDDMYMDEEEHEAEEEAEAGRVGGSSSSSSSSSSTGSGSTAESGGGGDGDMGGMPGMPGMGTGAGEGSARGKYSTAGSSSPDAGGGEGASGSSGSSGSSSSNTTEASRITGAAANSSSSMTGCPGLDLSDAPWYALEVNGDSQLTTGRPAVFSVAPGRRQRFRLIAATSSWAVVVRVEGHTLTVIALDGRPVAPRPAAGVVAAPGERVDFVLHFNATGPPANHLIHVTTLNGHDSPAVLSYAGAPDPLTDPTIMAAVRASASAAVTAADSARACVALVAEQAAAGGVLNPKNDTTLRAGAGVPPPPQAATRAFTIYLANAEEPDKAAAQAPPGFAARAARPGNVYGLPPGAARYTTLPGPPPPTTAAATGSSNGSSHSNASGGSQGGGSSSGGGCPPAPDGGRSIYCWSLNWNLFTPPHRLPILDVSAAGNAAAPPPAAAATAGKAAGNESIPRSPPPPYTDGPIPSSGGSGGGDGGGGTPPYTSNGVDGGGHDDGGGDGGVPYAVRLDLGDVVDLALVNPSQMVHPMHLHGMGFWILATGNGRITNDLTDELDWGRVAALAAAGRGSYNPRDPPLRDTTPVPQAGSSSGGIPGGSSNTSTGTGTSGSRSSSSISGSGSSNRDGYGYTVVRFTAASPGVFAFHCHTELHMASGMIMYFVVGAAAPQAPPAPAADDSSSSGGHATAADDKGTAAGGGSSSTAGASGGAGSGNSSGTTARGGGGARHGGWVGGGGWYVPSNLTCGASAATMGPGQDASGMGGMAESRMGDDMAGAGSGGGHGVPAAGGAASNK